MAEAAKEEVLRLVPKLTELQLLEVTAGIDLKLTKNKEDRKSALQNLLIRHVSSEEVEEQDDEGLALFTKLSTQMQELVQEDEEEKEMKETKQKLEKELEKTLLGLKSTVSGFDLNTAGGDSTSTSKSSGMDSSTTHLNSSNHEPLANQSVTQFHKLKLREFKISNGTVGGDSSLDYSDLVSQMKEGVESGYSEKEVISGVIRATKPGSELQKYLVRHPNMTFKDFKDTLREFYNIRESQNIMDEMRDMVQGPQQPLMKYVMAMCALRDEVFEVAQGEECPVGEPLIRKRFVSSLLSGLRNPTIRLEMQGILKQNLSDPQLFREVNLITTRQEENDKKLGGGQTKASVKAVEVDDGGRRQGRNKESEWQQETNAKVEALTAQVQKLEVLINKLATYGGGKVPTQVGEGVDMDQKMAALFGQVQHLTAQMLEYQNAAQHGRFGSAGGQGGALGGSKGGPPRKWFRKCDNCEKEKKFCNHCRKCGEEGHKEAKCEKN